MCEKIDKKMDELDFRIRNILKEIEDKKIIMKMKKLEKECEHLSLNPRCGKLVK